MRLHPFILPAVLFGIFAMKSAPINAEPSSPADYRLAIQKLENFVRHQISVHKLHGLAVALVDDQETVYAAGFGEAKKDSVFRAGSISKLFNAVAVMQLVERGRLDLDAPIQRYGRRFSIIVPFSHAAPITLREILCHRSGMTRESPVGGYLDDSEPTLQATVEAARSCVLLNPPNAKTRYSNIAPSVAGEILAVVVLCNDDIVTGPVAKISNAALAWMLEAKLGETPPPTPEPIVLSPRQIEARTGEYESQSRWAKIQTIDGRLVASLSGQPMSLTPVDSMKCLANGWLFNDVEVVFQQDETGNISCFTMSGQRFVRVDDAKMPETPPLWKDFAGFYGPKFIPMIVKVVHGHLYALIENEFEYRLMPLDRNIFVFPPGMYAEEHLVFFTRHHGETPAATLANQYLRRWTEKVEMDECRW